MGEKTKLKRVLGFPASYGAAVGLVVSGTAMFSVGSVIAACGKATPLASAIALIVVMCAAFAFGELAGMIPGGGMISEYTQPALGTFWGTFSLLSCYVVLIACDGGSQLVMGGIAFESIIGIPQYIITFALLIGIVLVNIFGVELYGKTESVITIAMMLIFIILAILGAFGLGESTGVATPVTTNPKADLGVAMANVGPAIWWFIGFEFACPMAEENKKPYKNIPYGLILGLISIFVVDNIFAIGANKYADLAEMAASSTPHVVAATATLGTVGGIVISLVTVCASFTTGNAYVAALPRMMYGLARENQVPKCFGKIHPKYRVPMYGIAFTVFLILLVTIWVLFKGDAMITTLINTACITWLVTYSIAMIDVLVLRKKYPDYPRFWKTPLAKITMPIGILGAAYSIYTLNSVLIPAIILMVVTALYTIIWNKAHNQPINEYIPLKVKVQKIIDTTEPIPVWDDAVKEWLANN